MPWQLQGKYRGSLTKINDIIVEDNKVYLINGVNGDGSDEFVFNISWINFLLRCHRAGYEVDYIHNIITENNSFCDDREWDNIYSQIEWGYYDG
jgi:hypothetical protein